MIKPLKIYSAKDMKHEAIQDTLRMEVMIFLCKE